jgi:hypothetical protein
VSDNRGTYPAGQAPVYEKFEITFQVVNTVARNLQLPYDPAPPAGIDLTNPSFQGITVNAHFTHDNWQTTVVQPAFFYQEYLNERRGNREWFYPTNQYSWKVRFAPHQAGAWQYKLTAQDASGSVESSVFDFVVAASTSQGFVQVSQNDPRYFELNSGRYFPALGYNLNFNALGWVNPVVDNEPNFQRMSQNGIHLARIWLSQWAIFTSAWNPWNSIIPAQNGQYIPFSGLTTNEAYRQGGSEISMIVNSASNPCMFIGWLKAPPAVKQNTNYRIRIRYMTQNIVGPRISGHPYGLTAKTGGSYNGGWLYDDQNGAVCDDPGYGVVVSSYASQNSYGLPDAWRILEGNWNSGNANFLPYFYLAMENVNSGRAFIDYVWIEEDLGGGNFGPNIVAKPWMSHHLYFEQRNSYAFDQVLDLAHQYGIYLRPVILEKNEWILNRIRSDGSLSNENPSNDYFYGEWRSLTKGRWLQRAWWRYLQARWGYSPNIHSWELLNEGDPGSSRHFAMTDELGKYMHCTVFATPVGAGDGQKCQYDHPNAHLVSTSNWHSFPASAFWMNASYPNVDFADVHAYVSTGWIDDPLHEDDAAAYHLDYSHAVRAMLDNASSADPPKPIIRGEAGLDTLNLQVEQADLTLDTNGVWLHNFLWSSLDEDGLIEQYWWTQNIEQRPGPDGVTGLHEIFGYFYDFLQAIPLNSGNYQPAGALASNPGLRVVGQKDPSHNRAHLWVQNKAHTWRNVIDGVANISGLSGNVTVGGFSPNSNLPVEWLEFTTQGLPSTRLETVRTDGNGVLTLPLPGAAQITDVGIRVGSYP